MDHDLKLLSGLRGRIRWIAGLLGGLSLVSALALSGHYERLRRETDLRNAFVRSSTGEVYRAEARAALAANRANLADGPRPGTWLVPVESMPELDWDLSLAVRAQMPAEAYRLGGQEVRIDALAAAVLLLPPLLLLVLIATLLQIGRVHRKLAPVADPGTEVQQRLNSLYFDRVTDRYREGWRLHAWAGGLIVLVLVHLPLVPFNVRRATSLDTRVAVDTAGAVYPGAPAPHVARIHIDASAVGFTLWIVLGNLALWAVLMWVALRRVPVPDRAGSCATEQMVQT